VADDVAVAVAPKRRQVLAGESLVVTTIVVNRGDRDALVHDPDQPSPFAYRLESAAEGGPRYDVSDLDRLLRRSSDEIPVPASEPAYPLAPGRRVSREEDLADLADEPFAPGRYRITVEYARKGGAIASPPASVEVTAPKVGQIASEVCPTQETLTTALAHVDLAEGVTLLQRESSAWRPAFGVFYRRHALPAGARLSGLSTAIDAADVPGGRWLAWLERATLGAVKGWGTDVMEPPVAVDTGLAEARLVRPGVQLEDASTLFWVAGTAGGAARLHQYSVSKAGLTRSFDVPLEAALPGDEARARLTPGGPVEIVWAERAAASGRLHLRRFAADGTRLDGGAVLAEVAEPLLAFALEPIARPENAALSALSGPDAEGRMAYRRVPLDPAAAPSEPVRFAPPDGLIAAGPEPWALLPTDEGDRPVLVHAGGKVLHTRARRGEGWTAIAADLRRVPHLQLLVMPDERSIFAEWVDPASGVRHRRLESPGGR